MKYKLFIADFDGTLGKAPGVIEPETVEAVKKYVDKGGIFVICTGRMTSSIRPICHRYGIKGIVVSYQGAMISEINSDKVYQSGGIDYKTAKQVVEEIKEQGVQAQIYVDDTLYFDVYNEYSKIYEKNCGVVGKVVDSLPAFLEEKKKNSAKVCGVAKPEKADEVVEILKEKFPQLICNKGEHFLIEVINPQFCKGKAVEFLAKHFNIDYSEILAVGDSTNDITLVDGPWHGVAVGDGMEQLKKVAKEITVEYKKQPIKVLLEKYCL